MEKEIELNKNKVKYNLKISRRARLMRLEVKQNGELVVTVPRGMNYSLVDKFIIEKTKWVIDKINYFESIRGKETLLCQGFGRARYLKYKEKAKVLAESRIEYYNEVYKNLYNNFKINPVKFREAEILLSVKLFDRVNRVSIKNTKSRWGSCSKKGNLNFNYKIALLSQELADYVIVHELCHLGEFNHSKKFWKLVSLTIPNYKESRLAFK